MVGTCSKFKFCVVVSLIVLVKTAPLEWAFAQGGSNPPPAEVLGSKNVQPDSDLTIQIHQCDLATAHPFDKHRPSDVPGVDFKLIDAPNAVAICEDATAKALDNNYYAKDRGRLSFELGRSYEKSGEAETAQLHYSLAVDDEHYAPAAYNLASFYLNGTGSVEKNIPKALELMEIAANDGFAPAQETLGRWYESGANGLPQNQVKAAQLISRASEQAYEPAKIDRERMLQALINQENERKRRVDACYWIEMKDCDHLLDVQIAICQASHPTHAEYEDCIQSADHGQCSTSKQRLCEVKCETNLSGNCQ